MTLGTMTRTITPIRIDRVNNNPEDQEWLLGEAVLITDHEEEDMTIVTVKENKITER